jgi:hypothetical protein
MSERSESNASNCSVEVTAHAIKRWKQRFPHLDGCILTEFRDANRQRVGRKLHKRIADQCGYKGKSRNFSRAYYKISSRGVIFAVAPQPTTILTVFPLKEPNQSDSDT